MKNKLPNIWINKLNQLDIAFQPILDIHSGEIFGVEALLRNFQEAGFKSIFNVFDEAFHDNVLYQFDLALREKTLTKYKTIDNYKNIKLFYNLDNRLFDMICQKDGNTKKILEQLNINKENIVFEISERHEISTTSNMNKVLQHYKDEKYLIAIDDFGVGYSGYKLLFESTPHIVKIDRFFLQDIEKDIKKKLLVRSITHLSIQLGIKVIAEGVETKEELLTCKDIGCHLVQGYLVQKPTQVANEILSKYQHITKIVEKNKKNINVNTKIKKYIDKIEPIKIDIKMSLVVKYFQRNQHNQIVPIINSINEPLGILHESAIKEFLYSPFGISLLSNEDIKKAKLKHLMDHCGSADINSSISTIIELFSNNPESSGILITKELKYYGFLSARSIITIMNEESLLLARDQNPLTKLPGNMMIEKYTYNCIKSSSNYILCYFDLDNFKAFNDVYGFRDGDRVIHLFADKIRKHLSSKYFKAHIGGDDFFVAIEYSNNEFQENFIKDISTVITKFTQSVREFYSKEDRESGFIIAKDRDGNTKKFPLLTVSASILILSKHSKKRTVKNINKILAIQKKVAKLEPNHIAASSFL